MCIFQRDPGLGIGELANFLEEIEANVARFEHSLPQALPLLKGAYSRLDGLWIRDCAHSKPDRGETDTHCLPPYIFAGHLFSILVKR